MNKTAKGNWPLYCAWLAVLIITAGISCVYHLESASFSGIAETREIVVNSEAAVDIRRINVTEGQSVEKGSLLVELSSPELVLKINHIEHQLDELKARKGVDKTEIQSRIRQLQAEKTARENEISSQIAELENQYRINRNMLSDLKSVPFEKGHDDEDSNPVKLKIRNLKKELGLSVNSLSVQIELLQKTLANAGDPVEIQVERLEKELVLLRRENSRLNIYAQISGIIGSVNFKPGEKVSPFTPILTLHTKTPSFIKGYIYENACTHINMGDRVDVASLTEAGSIIPGQVVGIGARIVEYPVRLRKHPDFQVWGREVLIRIPESNPLILGEKVSITANAGSKGMTEKIRNIVFPDESRAETPYSAIKSRKAGEKSGFVPIDKKGLEASGILYLRDAGKYLVVSDDTPDDSPVLYLVNSKGEVTDEAVIEGAGKIRDIESVTEGENGTVYIASSSGVNKKGETRKNGTRLVSFKRDKTDFSMTGSMDLYSGLKACAEKSTGESWADFVLNGMASSSIDIEGMSCRNGSILLGFKAPFMDGQSVILGIRDIDSVIQSGSIRPEQVFIWRKISLGCEDGSVQERISDLCYAGDTLYLTGTSEERDADGRSGSLWRLDDATGTVTRLMIFNGRAPEGICAAEDNNNLAVCFDGGGKGKSEMTMVNIQNADIL